MSHVGGKVAGKTGMKGSIHKERSLAQEEGILREYDKHIPLKSNEQEEDMDQRFVGKDSQWLGILGIGIGTINSELGNSLLVSGGGNSSG